MISAMFGFITGILISATDSAVVAGAVVSVGSVFRIPVSVNGSHSDIDNLVFDTGSPHTWIYHYRYVRQLPAQQGGGYPITGLRTRITPPTGGNRLEYADEDVFHADVWTQKTFTIGDHSWLQPFGVVHEANQRGVIPGVTGLLGASRASPFTTLHPTFGFKPIAKGSLTLSLSRFNATESCREGNMSYFSLARSGRFARYWGTDGELSFGSMALRGGMIFDTGSSVIALPATAFAGFRRLLSTLGIRYNYQPRLLAGVIPCSDVSKLPSWKLQHASKTISITPAMYVRRVSLTQCVIQVCELSDRYPIILGLPLLEHVVSEFDSSQNRVGICHATVAFVNDRSDTPFEARDGDFYDCPSCNDSQSLGTRQLIWLSIILTVGLHGFTS